MKDVYIISTVHHEWNLKFNLSLCEALEKRGISIHLPQRDTNQKAQPKIKFSQNIKAMKNSRTMIAVAQNETPNWGAEVGFCHGMGKKIVAVAGKNHAVPLMASGMIDKVIRSGRFESMDFVGKLAKAVRN